MCLSPHFQVHIVFSTPTALFPFFIHSKNRPFPIPSYTSVIYIFMVNQGHLCRYNNFYIDKNEHGVLECCISVNHIVHYKVTYLYMYFFFVFSASGKIRAAIGKANLLVNQKFKQFEELCYEHMVRNVVLHIIVISGCCRDRMLIGFTT